MGTEAITSTLDAADAVTESVEATVPELTEVVDAAAVAEAVSTPAPVETVNEVAEAVSAPEPAAVVNDVTETVSEPLAAVKETTEALTQDVESTTGALEETVGAVNDTVGSVNETANTVTDPLTDALSDATNGATDPLTDPLTDVVTDTTNTVEETVTGATDAVNETVGAVTETANAAATPLTNAVSETTVTAENTLAGTVKAVDTAANDTAGTAGTTAPLVAEASAPVAETTAPVVNAIQPPIAEATTPFSSVPEHIVQPIAGTPPVPAPDTLVPVPGNEAVEVVVSPIDIGTKTLVGPPERVDASSWTEGLADAMIGVEPIQAVGATALVAAGALVIARGASSPTSSMLFTNVRLFPGFVSATIQQGTTAISSGTHLGARMAALAPSPAALAPSRVLPPAASIVAPFREGIDRTLGGLPVDDYTEGRERLMAQIGIVLGTIYLAFLTMWFWATRLRWNGGWRV